MVLKISPLAVTLETHLSGLEGELGQCRFGLTRRRSAFRQKTLHRQLIRLVDTPLAWGPSPNGFAVSSALRASALHVSLWPPLASPAPTPYS